MSFISFCRCQAHVSLKIGLKRNLKSTSFTRDTAGIKNGIKNGAGVEVALVRKRWITTESARELLQLYDKQRGSGAGDGFIITRAQLRSSYLQAAMLCHPGTYNYL
jgi:hypothetical protein